MNILMSDQIRNAIQQRHTILVVGLIGSGRTQLLYEIADEAAALFPAERVAVLCDIKEKFDAGPDNLTCYAGKRDVTNAIREANTWLFVDELRGSEAADLLDAWRKGHAGGAAVHGASVQQGLSRLKALSDADAASIGLEDCISMVVLMERTAQGACVKEMHRLS